MKSKYLFKIGSAIFLLIFLASCLGRYQPLSREPESFAKGNISAARSYALLLEKKCQASPPDSHLQDVFRRLTEEVEDRISGFELLVVNCPDVNAQSIPAIKKVYLFQGLLKLNLNTDELAFVLAHEIAHHFKYPKEWSYPGYETELERGMQDVKVNYDACLGFAERAHYLKKEAQARCTGDALEMITLKYMHRSQQMENGVDQIALDLMMDAGFDGEAASTFLEKLIAASPMQATVAPLRPDGTINWTQHFQEAYSTHAPARERLRALTFRAKGPLG